MIPGIDVAHWQKQVDWHEVAESGVKFAFCKATEGVGYVDPTFKKNWHGIKSAGLMRGAYHFARVSKSDTLLEDAEAEANHFCDTVLNECPGKLLRDGDFPLVLDIEWDKRAKGIKGREIVIWVRRFLHVVNTRTGRPPIVYTGPSFWKYRLVSTMDFAGYPLWSANYRKRIKQIPGWPAKIWQFTGKGTCPGIRGKVDRNWWLGDWAELQKFTDWHEEIKVVIPLALQESAPLFANSIAALVQFWQGVARRSKEGKPIA